MSSTPAIPTPFEPKARTIHDMMVYLGLNDWRDPAFSSIFLRWPPDVYAAMATLLRESGAYMRVVSPPPEALGILRKSASEWNKHIEQNGTEWRDHPMCAPPPAVQSAWDALTPFGDILIPDLIFRTNLWTRIIELLVIADRACEGIGTPGSVSEADLAVGKTKHSSLLHAPRRGSSGQMVSTVLVKGLYRLMLQARAIGKRDQKSREPSDEPSPPRTTGFTAASTLCELIDPSRAIVLPKMRTPQRGITIRSMSLNLSLVTGTDVFPRWIGFPPDPNEKQQGNSLPGIGHRTHNLLLVPWPFSVSPSQFRPVQLYPRVSRRFAKRHDLFGYHHATAKSLRPMLDRLLEVGRDAVGTIDGLVLPEVALTKNDFQKSFNDGDIPLMMDLKFIISGVYQEGDASQDRLGRNAAFIRCRVPDIDHLNEQKVFTYVQNKHHRWALDADQIRTYGIGSGLHPERLWWEGIDLPPREVFFFAMHESCVFSVLICEDLARPDPLGDVIRAVGPNLVIGLLQDGPQLSDRWSARYAMSLVDDPGCSVLTLTSLGMSELSRPKGREMDPKKSRTVAMWRDPTDGIHEIVLPSGAQALVVSLSDTRTTEFTADGRNDKQHAGCLRLSGVYPITENGPVR